jgi:oligopeptide/dipeptide ABC transporter ATP-binding protein
MTKEILVTKQLKVTYPTPQGAFVAVDNVDLTLRSGEIVGLIGESGSGKTSLALALLALVRHPGALSGEVVFEGENLLALGYEQLREIRGRSIGLITQKPRQSLNPFLNVGTQIGRVYRAHVKADKEQAKAHAVELLESVGINDATRRVRAYPHELSGGMAQRALISMALSAQPELLVADEPTSGLDVTIQAQFLDRMWQRAEETGTAVLLVTQDLGIVANYCDRVLVLENGKLVEDAPTREFFANPRDAYSKRVLMLAGERALADTAAVTEDAPPLIRIEGLRKTFTLDDGKVLSAVSDVSLAVREGQSLGLVGESGSGKTTVGRLILRLLDADAGEIWFRDTNLATLKPREFRDYRAKIQVVFQDPFDSLNPRWSVEKVIREPLDLHTQMSKQEKADRITELLEQVGLPPEVRNSRPGGLSAGQQQRVCLARAMATHPEFLVLDEPTSALPPVARVEMIALLKDLRERLGLSFIFISHDLSTVRELCQDVAVMYLSQIVEMGPTAKVFAHPEHPYTKALLDSVLFHDPNNRRVDRDHAGALQGEIPSPVDLPEGCYLAGRCPLVEERCRQMPQELELTEAHHLVRCWKAVQAVRTEANPVS